MREPYVVALGPTDIDEYFSCETPVIIGGKCCVRKLGVFPGGFTANAAGVMGTMGLKTYLLDTLGTDEYTEMLVESLKKLNIDTEYLQILPDYENLKTSIFLSEGERTIFIHENHKPPVTVTEEVLALLLGAKYLYTTICNLKELPDYRELVRSLKERGVKIMVDVESPTFVSREDPEDAFLFEAADIISFNTASYAKYSAGESGDFLKKLAAREGKIVMVTMGENGARICTETEDVTIPAFPVKAIDTTGAGDTHNAAFLYAHLKGRDIVAAGTYAAGAAARAVTLQGAQAGAASERIVNEFMEKNCQ